MNLLRSDYGKKFSQKGNWSILLNTISDVNKRLKFLSDDILKLKDFLSTESCLGEIQTHNTEAWLIKIACVKSRESKSRLDS